MRTSELSPVACRAESYEPLIVFPTSHLGNFLSVALVTSLPQLAHDAMRPDAARRATIERGRHRPGHAPRPVVADVLGALAGLGFGVTLALVAINESSGTLTSPGGWFNALGRLCGFAGSYLLLMMVLLMARIPWLERAVGQDQLVRWHRRIGGWPIALIALHIMFVVVGYSRVDRVSWIEQINTFIFHYPDVLAALVGFGLFVMAGLSSYRVVRRRQAYETW